MNDPRESKAWHFSLRCPTDKPEPGFLLGLIEDINDRIKRNCKMVCFTRDNPIRSPVPTFLTRGFGHPRMWAQYADHSGVCLILDQAKVLSRALSDLSAKGAIYHGRVFYEDEESIDSIKAFEIDYDNFRVQPLDRFAQQHLKSHHRNLFFRKAVDWASEWEYRIVLCSSTPDDEYVSIEDSLVAICLGVDFPKVYEPLIVDVCKRMNLVAGRIEWSNGFPEILPIL